MSLNMRNLHELPKDLPRPIDDGTAGNLVGKTAPDLRLISHAGDSIRLSEAFQGKTVLFIFPRAGNSIRPNPAVEEWDLIPGARGCTPQSCGFKNLAQDFTTLGFQIFGLSTQTPDILSEVALKNHLPFDLLSDSDLELTKSLQLPTFLFHGETLLKRMVLLFQGNQIFKVFYPVFPPDQNADEVLVWIKSQR